MQGKRLAVFTQVVFVWVALGVRLEGHPGEVDDRVRGPSFEEEGFAGVQFGVAADVVVQGSFLFAIVGLQGDLPVGPKSLPAGLFSL